MVRLVAMRRSWHATLEPHTAATAESALCNRDTHPVDELPEEVRCGPARRRSVGVDVNGVRVASLALDHAHQRAMAPRVRSQIPEEEKHCYCSAVFQAELAM